jgi:ACS family glucarate transporter-like MFS transporter
VCAAEMTTPIGKIPPEEATSSDRIDGCAAARPLRASSVTRKAFPAKPLISATTIALTLLCLMYAITYIDRVNVSTAALVFQHDLKLSNTQVGLVFSAFAYPYLVLTAFGGWLSDRWGARRMLTISALIWGSATLYTGMTTGLAGMLMARALLGVGEGATFPIATRAMCDWLPQNKWAMAQGATHASSRLGTALTPPLVAWLIAVITWRGSFFVLGAISLVWALMWFCYFRDDPRNHAWITERELRVIEQGPRPEKTAKPIPWLALVRRMLPVTAVYFCYGWTLWLYLAWIPSYFLHSYHLKITSSAVFSSGVFISGVVGDILGGVVSDRILRRTADHKMARRNLVVGGFIASLAMMVLLFFVHDVLGGALCLSLAFFFVEFTIGPMWAIPMDIAPDFAGSASGLMNIGSPLAAIISPLVFGYIIDKSGSWVLPFAGSIAVLLFGSIVAFWMKPEVRFLEPA